MITNVIFTIFTESLLFSIIFTTFVVNNLNRIYMKELVS
ncbi:histone H1-like protein, partial [Butyricimonas virosa]